MNKSGISPVGYRVLVKPEPIEERTAGGIIIAQTDPYKQAQCAGTVVAIGEDCWREFKSPWAKVGDRVLFAKYGGLMRKGLDGEEYRILNDEQITCVISKDLNVSDIEHVAKRKAVNV